jgi:hypothetical protein
MNTNMNFPAPLAVLGFLALFGGLGAAVLLTITGLFVGKPRLVRWTWKVTAIAGFTYLLVLLGFSVISRERLLHRGQEKYFCEIDCHLAYSLVDVKTFPSPTPPLTEYRLTVRTRFDEKTISEDRGDSPLTPNPRTARLVDKEGRQYLPAGSSERSFNTSLRPGETYDVSLIFDVPTDAKGLKLLITSSDWQEWLLIGDENSLLHRHTYFALSI